MEKNLVEMKFRIHEEVLNDLILRLWVFNAGPKTRMRWKEQIRGQLQFLAQLKLTNSEVSDKDVYEWLYADPFNGDASHYIKAFLERYTDDFPRGKVSIAAISEWINTFYFNLTTTWQIIADNPEASRVDVKSDKPLPAIGMLIDL